MKFDATKLSKTISHALRHEPHTYGLMLDGEGFVAIGDLLLALGKIKETWELLTEQDLIELAASFDKQRFEIKEHKIRAFYGHSMPQKITKTPAIPPDMLYHGTSPKSAESILGKGLLPGKRHYVHLSLDTETAFLVGKRKCHAPVIFRVDAKRASLGQIKFYLGNEKIWLSDHVPPEYLTITKKGN